MKVHVLGVDLAKNVFQLHGVDRKGRCVLVRRVRRDLLMNLVAELDPCLIGIEACTGAFYWQRQFERHYGATIWMRTRIASLNFVPEGFSPE